MSKAPMSETIMPAAKMKPLLALSKREPVQAAIGLSADGEGLLLLDKKAAPRKVLAMLRASADKAKLKLSTSSLRFGRAEVDVDYDPGVVRLFINKDAPGAMRLRLTEVVKRIPYQKVEINVDPSLEEENGDEGDGVGEGAVAEQDGAAGQDAAPAPAPPPPAPPPPAPPPPVPQPPAPAALDAAGLTQQLRVLIGRVPQAAAAAPARKAELTRLAFEVGGDLKAGKLQAAAEALERLRAALDGDPAAPAATPGATAVRGAGGDWAAARQAWQDANDEVNDQINGLRSALLKRAKGGDDEAELFADALTDIAERGLNAITGDLRVKLMAAVMELGSGATPAGDGKAAIGHIEAFQAFLDGNEKIEVCDGNPFGAAVSIRATLSPALQRMTAALQPARGR